METELDNEDYENLFTNGIHNKDLNLKYELLPTINNKLVLNETTPINKNNNNSTFSNYLARD